MYACAMNFKKQTFFYYNVKSMESFNFKNCFKFYNYDYQQTTLKIKCNISIKFIISNLKVAIITI